MMALAQKPIECGEEEKMRGGAERRDVPSSTCANSRVAWGATWYCLAITLACTVPTRFA